MGLVGTFKTMDLQELQSLETIDPSPTAPWDNRGFPDVSIPTNKERALEEAASARHGGGVLVYTDAKGAALGAAVLIQIDGSAETQLTYQIGIGSASEWHVHCAEMIAISQEIKLIEENNFVNLGTRRQQRTEADYSAQRQPICDHGDGRKQAQVRAYDGSRSATQGEGTPCSRGQSPPAIDTRP